jgi:threonine/homoserine/homoserine lactone efflux protein
MALKFWLKAREIAIGLKGLRSSPNWISTDDIHLETSDVKAFTDALFTNSSMPTKVLMWLENESQFLASQKQTSRGNLPIKKLS